jgi:hypothetical protein
MLSKEPSLKYFMFYGLSIYIYHLENYKDYILSEIKITTAKMMKIKNKFLAICMEEPAIFVNPNNAATIAITKKIIAQFNINSSFL